MLHLLETEGLLLGWYFCVISKAKPGELEANAREYNDCAEHWSHTRRCVDLRHRLDLNILVLVHRRRTMLVDNDPRYTRDFSKHRRQRINQTIKVPTITYYDVHVSPETQQRCCRTQMATAGPPEILGDTCS